MNLMNLFNFSEYWGLYYFVGIKFVMVYFSDDLFS